MARRPELLSAATTLVTTMTLLLSSMAYAQDETNRGAVAAGPNDWLDGRAEIALELDETQRARLREMRAEMLDDLEPIANEVRSLKQELEQAWSAAYPDGDTILNLNEWLLVMDTLVRERGYDFRFEVLELLEPWQREALADVGAADDERHSGRPQGELPRFGRLVRELDLDEYQQGPVFDLLDDLQYFTTPARGLLEELEKELEMLWAEEQPDEDAIYEVDEDMDALRWMIREREVGFYLALHELLDGDQRELLSRVMSRDGRRDPGAGDARNSQRDDSR